jgi:hypothetical protein
MLAPVWEQHFRESNPRLEKRRPGMRALDSCTGCERRLRENTSLLFLDHPAAQTELVTRQNAAMEPDPQIDGESFPVPGYDRLRHGFVQDRCDYAAVNRTLKAFPLIGGDPRGINSVPPPLLKHQMQPLRVM